MSPWVRPHPALPVPAGLRSWPVIAALVLFVSVPFFLPIPPYLRHHPIFSFLGDQVHIPLFGITTFLLYWFGPLRGRLWAAAGTAAVLGVAVEFIQLLVGRSALVQDWLLDLVGIGMAVGFILWKGHRSRWGLRLILILLISQPIQLRHLPGYILATLQSHEQFPLIADFEGGHVLKLWDDNNDGVLTFGPSADPTAGNETSVLHFTGAPPSHWPGAEVRKFPPDWSAYEELVFDVRLASEDLEKVTVYWRLDDFAGRRESLWASNVFTARPDWRTRTISLPDLQVGDHVRPLDLTDVDMLLFFLASPDRPVTLEFDNIHLR